MVLADFTEEELKAELIRRKEISDAAKEVAEKQKQERISKLKCICGHPATLFSYAKIRYIVRGMSVNSNGYVESGPLSKQNQKLNEEDSYFAPAEVDYREDDFPVFLNCGGNYCMESEWKQIPARDFWHSKL